MKRFMEKEKLIEWIKYILQDEIAREVFYESKHNEERLNDLLNNAERRLADYCSQILQDCKAEMGEKIKVLKQNTEYKLDGTDYRNSIIFNQAIDQVLQILKSKE